MVTVTVEVSEKFTKRRVRCTAQSIERAIEIASGFRSTSAKVLFPIDPQTFFANAVEHEITDEAVPLESRPKEGARS